ncbi:hypothetical protein KIW84_063154 [Lathyrus oleraceus]|uniref:Uncharacterized protein n=1 Tax=Pisum sativum TaxID=3888 RepID=A0A9D5A4F8_PEA|nr:hypothetical protein KIW84_063154 [Pisum sativum]
MDTGNRHGWILAAEGGSALELLTKALAKSLYSERLLQVKANALYLLQKYDAAIQLCDQNLNLAEKNFVLASSVNNSMHNGYSSVKMWRGSFISKCYLRLGKLDASLNVIEKLQQQHPAKPVGIRSWISNKDKTMMHFKSKPSSQHEL